MSDQGPRKLWLVLLTAWATFFFYSAIAVPVPGVNEPHYLCKARNFWQPNWCSQDFFLTSPNAHSVFYATIGALTNVFSFEQSAWIGRAVATLILAWGWTRCFSHLFFKPWAPVWCSWLFLIFASCGNFSGEWLVGGVEGKVFSYGFLLVAFGDAFGKRWKSAALWTGIGISFHPVVGMWGLLAFAASFFSRLFFARPLSIREARSAIEIVDERTGDRAMNGSTRSALTEILLRQLCWSNIQLGLIVLLCALPGLIPVIRLLTEPVSEQTRYEATYLQVYFRLAHHLDPMRFPRQAYIGYAILIGIWLGSWWWGGRTNFKNAFDHLVLWAIIFAVAGILIGSGPRPPVEMPYYAERMNLLKFYPFRLADVLVPIAVAVSIISVLERTILNVSCGPKTRFPIPIAAMFLLFLCGLIRAYSTSETNRYSYDDRKDWLDICQWIDDHLPADVLIESPTNCWAFKWFAHRAEYVAFKDCPQNAEGIVEWNRRLVFLKEWYEQNYADEKYSAVELRDLRKQTGLTHLLTDRIGPLELDPIYRNGTFQVYDLRSLDHF